MAEVTAGSLTDINNIMAKALEKETPVKYIDTGNVGLDLALTDGKGLPLGSSILLWADPGIGKTTVVGDLCKRLIKMYNTEKEPFRVLYLATEDSAGLLASMGLWDLKDTQHFIYISQNLCWRQIEGIYEKILKAEKSPWKDVKLIVIDSVNNVLSDQNLKGSIADGDFGTRNRERNGFYSKIFPQCKSAGICTILISQARARQNAGLYADTTRAAVSKVDLHNVDIILKCSAMNNKTDASKIEEETVFGIDKVANEYIFKMDSKAQDCKNRYVRGNAVEILVERGKCVHNEYAVRKMLEANKFAKYSSGYFSFEKDLCEKFNLPDKKMRLKEANKIVAEHVGELIDFLKAAGKYKVGIKETVVPITEEDLAEESENE